ncbi:hypothetical protein [Nocardia lijiangensis]|uniref:hypothetical protein n=1 Tax=Nocardia lijiangensis TaxID=299618 RepID=UPI00082AB487|nr:hypothetical protein [Nocardia lijiangensis]
MSTTEQARGYWKPGAGIDFHRVAVSVDRGRVRESCEVFANVVPAAEQGRQIQLVLHKETQFAAVAHLAMTVDDAIAVVRVLQAAIRQAAGTDSRGAA